MTNLSKYKDDLKGLLKTANFMRRDVLYRSYNPEQIKKLKPDEQRVIKSLHLFFEKNYQSWYTEAMAVIKQIIPDRLNEFVELYSGDGKRRDVTSTSYTIKDWLGGARLVANRQTGEKAFNESIVIINRIHSQTQILASAEKRFISSLFDIRQLVQADLFDSEIDVSRELLSKGFNRAAGAICGVILEKHLKQVCSNHDIVISKKKPTISFFNDLLKTDNVIEISTWRFIQRLGDLRNLSSHDDKEPTKEEIDELINGTDKIMKTLF